MAWELLFTSDIGLMSLVVIVGVLIIGAVMGSACGLRPPTIAVR